jgi:hypothetical protein
VLVAVCQVRIAQAFYVDQLYRRNKLPSGEVGVDERVTAGREPTHLRPGDVRGASAVVGPKPGSALIGGSGEDLGAIGDQSNKE